MDDREVKKYRTIRGGISWPIMTENLPAYYCMFGEEWVKPPLHRQRQEEKRRLNFICEYEAPDIYASLTAFFTKLTDDATHHLCYAFYTVIEDFQGEDFRGYAEAFQRFAYDKGTIGRLEQAPWADRTDLGIHHITSWNNEGRLEIPEDTLLREQLRMVRADMVKELPHKLNAVNAMRFVVCGYEKNRPNNLVGWTPNRGKSWTR